MDGGESSDFSSGWGVQLPVETGQGEGEESLIYSMMGDFMGGVEIHSNCSPEWEPKSLA